MTTEIKKRHANLGAY